MLEKVKEIGSEFGLPLDMIFMPDKISFTRYLNLGDNNSIFLNSGRAALKFCLKYCIKYDPEKEFLLPSYLCSTLIQPFTELGIKFGFYKVNETLNVDFRHLKSLISSKVQGLLFIHYFGFKQNQEFLDIVSELREHGIKIIEDLSQAVFSKNLGTYGNYSFASVRKFFPLPDGGYLRSNNHDIPRIDLNVGYGEFWTKRFLGLIYKNLYLQNKTGSKEFFMGKLREAENSLDREIEISLISEYSTVLLNKFDYEQIKKRRKANFRYLLNNLKNKHNISSLFSSLADDVCPLAFPIIVEKRDRVKALLIKNKIYPPIHWKAPGEVNDGSFKESRWLSNHILSIPCDQRYEPGDMQRIIGVLDDSDWN